MPNRYHRRYRFNPLFHLVARIWMIEVVNLFMNHQLCRFGILPRSLDGLVGIPLSPLLHASPGHLLLNTGPLVILGGLVLISDGGRFLKTTLFIILVGGAGIWLVGRPSYHVGASALIFGYLGFLLARGLLDRRVKSLFIALLTAVAYGGMLWGLLPSRDYVSWEGHVCGFAAGILAAWFAAR